ncbi:MAG: hypothetical protein QXQ91_01525 [Nanopusillaceae archaeon]
MNLGRRAGLGLALVPLILVLTAAVAASDRWFYNGSIYISYFYGDGSGIEDWVFTGKGTTFPTKLQGTEDTTDGTVLVESSTGSTE